RILSGQSSEGPALDRLDAPDTRNAQAARRLGIAARRPLAEILDQRACRRAVHLQALAHGFLAIVLALDQRLSGRIVASRDLRRIELDVVRAAGSEVHAPPAHALDDLVVAHV